MPRNIPGTKAGIGLTAHERGRLATSTVFDPHPLGSARGARRETERRIIMRTLSRLMIAAGVLGTIAGTGATTALAQGVYLQGPGFGVDIGRPAYRERHYYRGYSDYDSPRFYSEKRYHRSPQLYERHSYRWRDRDWD